MPDTHAAPRQSLRLWPGVLIVALMWLARFGLPLINPDYVLIGIMTSLVLALAMIVWWMFFSRAPWSERLAAPAIMVAAVAATPFILHESIAKGAMGMLFIILVIPGLCLAFVLWAVTTRRLAGPVRYATMVAAILLGCGVWALARTGGFTGNFDNDLSWRWEPTPEERLLARGEETPSLPSAPESAKAAEARALAPGEEPEVVLAAVPETAAAEWPGFRGPDRDGSVRGVRIATDWTASPPVELWRRPVGPGWSSFAVRGNYVYTQEQRGDDEVVSAYDVKTGAPLWRHRDTARFWESNGGAGPRGTPTIDGERVYTFGATGILNALEARTGRQLWSRNAAADAEATLPDWGFSSSPVVVGDLVIVAASGRLVAYDAAGGSLRWRGPAGGTSYSSPHLVTIDGVEQVVLLNSRGAVGVAPADGTVLWQHEWGGYPIVQPALTADGNVLISVRDSSGTRRLDVGRGSDGWSVQERWTSSGLKPYFNDFVVHEGHAYGFDGFILACIDLTDGTRKWKGGRYGHGQLVLLPEQDLLLVLSEDGELVLVRATAEGFSEVARAPAIEGKTWNHPVLVRDVLLVRNGQEMAAFRLPATGR